MTQVVAVTATADRVEGTWYAQVVTGPLQGLFAWGESFRDARQALAAVVWAALSPPSCR